ncbi:unnamed protein product [Prunus armeniaca]
MFGLLALMCSVDKLNEEQIKEIKDNRADIHMRVRWASEGKCKSRRGQSTHKLKGHEITWECERWIRTSWLCVLTVQNYVSALDLHNDPKLASLSELILAAGCMIPVAAGCIIPIAAGCRIPV